MSGVRYIPGAEAHYIKDLSFVIQIQLISRVLSVLLYIDNVIAETFPDDLTLVQQF